MAQAGEPSAASGATDTVTGISGSDGLQDTSLEDLVLAANTHYNNAQAQLRAGNWAAYGEEMQALQTVIQQLAQVTGVPVETPAAAPAAEATVTPVIPEDGAP